MKHSKGIGTHNGGISKHSKGIVTHREGIMKHSRGIGIANTSARSWNRGCAASNYRLAINNGSLTFRGYQFTNHINAFT